MESLRVSRGIEIEVNDNGETIVVDIDNLNFAKSLTDTLNVLKGFEAEVNKVEFKEEKTEEDKVDNMIVGLNKTVELMERFTQTFDGTFGEGASRKVFGEGVLPSPFAVMDFYDQFKRIVDKKTSEREKWLNDRYKPRKGGR
jgi:hypothetical protein